MNQPKDLLSIGAFANMTRLSLKALRLYDQLNLLRPCHVDPQSGYRYYEADQLPRARRIRILRQMDMPLDSIRQVLAAMDVSPAQAEALVNEYIETRERQIEQIREQVHHFIQSIYQEAQLMSLEVNVKNIAPQQIVSVTRRVKVDKLSNTIMQTLDMLFNLIKEQNATADGEAFGIYHGTINEQDDGPIEICVPVSANIKATGEVSVKQLEGGKAASVIMLGAQCDFPAILSGYDATADWIQKNGYEMAGSPREIWYSEPGKDAKMEVIWLFK